MSQNSNEKIKKIKNFTLQVRQNILEMAVAAGASSSHFGGALSIAEIVSTLFSYQMKIDKNNPKWSTPTKTIDAMIDPKFTTNRI